MSLREINESLKSENVKARKFCELLEQTWDPEVARRETDAYMEEWNTPIPMIERDEDYEYVDWTESPFSYERS